jgi:hypothetical protein
MSKQKQTQTQTDSVFVDPTSWEDAGYKQARIGEASRNMAQWALSRCPGIAEEVPKEIRAGLYAGFQLRKHELEGDKYYKLGDGGTYIPLKDKPDDSVKGVVCMTINSAMSYSQQEYGKMRETDPAKHAIILPFRDAFSDYAGNALRALQGAVRRLQNEGKPRERGANKAFREAMKAAFDTYEKRVKTAKDRGDIHADPVKYKLAVDAFWKAFDA